MPMPMQLILYVTVLLQSSSQKNALKLQQPVTSGYGISNSYDESITVRIQ